MIFRLYYDALRIIWKNKIAFVLAALYFLDYYVGKFTPINPGSFASLVLNFLNISVLVALEIYVVLVVFSESHVIKYSSPDFEAVGKYFWKGMRLQVISGLGLLAVFALLLYFISFFKSDFLSHLFFWTLFYVLSLLGSGFLFLGIFVLIRDNTQAVPAMIAGYRELISNFLFYAKLTTFTSFLAFIPTIIMIVAGSMIAETSIFSVPPTPFLPFLQNYANIMSAAQRYDFVSLLGILLMPLQLAALSLAFISRQSPVVNRKS